jgi:hypothetical protein
MDRVEWPEISVEGLKQRLEWLLTMTTDASARQHLIAMICRNSARFAEQTRLPNARLSREQEQRGAMAPRMKRELRKFACTANKRGATGIADCGRGCAGEQSIPSAELVSAIMNSRNEAARSCFKGGPLPWR